MTATAADSAFEAQERMGFVLAAKKYAREAYDRSAGHIRAGAAWGQQKVQNSTLINKVRGFFAREGVRQPVRRVGGVAKALAFAALGKIQAAAEFVGLNNLRRTAGMVFIGKNLVAGYMLLKLWSTGAMHSIVTFAYGIVRWIMAKANDASAWAENKLHGSCLTDVAEPKRHQRFGIWVADKMHSLRVRIARADAPIRRGIDKVFSPVKGNKWVVRILKVAEWAFGIAICLAILAQDVLLGLAFVIFLVVLHQFDKRVLTPRYGPASKRRAWFYRQAKRVPRAIRSVMVKLFGRAAAIAAALFAAMPFVRTSKVEEDESETVHVPPAPPAKPAAQPKGEVPTPAEVFADGKRESEKPKGRPTPKQPNQAKRHRANKRRQREAHEQYAAKRAAAEADAAMTPEQPAANRAAGV